ncbi:PKD domain-containing protein, partial [Thermodesulfobacteriota bacterium]
MSLKSGNSAWIILPVMGLLLVSAIRSAAAPPLANFTAAATDLPLTVRFIDCSTESPTAWQWDLDNNGSIDAVTADPVFTYPRSGVYTVKLTVGNSEGNNT